MTRYYREIAALKYEDIEALREKPCMHSVWCKSCHNTFQFDCHKLNIQKEFAYTDGYDYDVDFYHYEAYEKCPICGTKIKVVSYTSI